MQTLALSSCQTDVAKDQAQKKTFPQDFESIERVDRYHDEGFATTGV